jgi:hypothetical protein
VKSSNLANVTSMKYDRLCGPVARVLGNSSQGPGFDSRRYQMLRVIVGLERGPFSLMRINEEPLE